VTAKTIALAAAFGALAATDASAQSVGTQSWVPNLGDCTDAYINVPGVARPTLVVLPAA
jgi:hypothetical protein